MAIKWVAVLSAIVAFGISGCGSSGDDQAASSEPKTGGTLVYARTANGANLDNLDPLDEDLQTNNAYTLDKVFEGLVYQDARGKIVPLLAQSYKVSDDGLLWTFNLRTGVKFSDGSPLTSADVVYSLQRHIKVGGALPLSAPITAVAAAGPDVVTISLAKPYTPLLAELATFASVVVPDNLQGKDAKVFFNHPIGTGPFVLESWDHSTGNVTFARNKDYWQQGKPYLDKVKVVYIADNTQFVQQIQSGQINVADVISPSSVEELAGNSKVSVQSVKSWNQNTIEFNTTSGPFTDKALRRAVSYAIDRDAIARATTFGTGTGATSYLPPTVQYSEQHGDYLLYNLDKAKEEIARSRYPHGVTVNFRYRSGTQYIDQQAQIIQAQLAKIGITVNLKAVENPQLWEYRKTRDFDIILFTPIADTSDPDNATTWLLDGKKDYFATGYKDAALDALIQRGREAADGDDRASVYKQIQEKASQDAPLIPLVYLAEIKATTSDVHGLEVIPNGTTRWQNVWIEH
ncbi:MAG: ABC transporter substrate-binding protein [Gordonia sp. (in: high G+C Gram-positive bacteria)]